MPWKVVDHQGDFVVADLSDEFLLGNLRVVLEVVVVRQSLEVVGGGHARGEKPCDGEADRPGHAAAFLRFLRRVAEDGEEGVGLFIEDAHCLALARFDETRVVVGTLQVVIAREEGEEAEDRHHPGAGDDGENEK